jgi:hypothetical protein
MWILDYTQLDLAILLYYYTTADKFEQLRRLILPKKSRIISENFLDKFLALIRPACHAPVHALFYPGLVVDLPVLLHSIAVAPRNRMNTLCGQSDAHTTRSGAILNVSKIYSFISGRSGKR